MSDRTNAKLSTTLSCQSLDQRLDLYNTGDSVSGLKSLDTRRATSSTLIKSQTRLQVTSYLHKLFSLTVLGILAMSISTSNVSTVVAQDDAGPKIGDKIENFTLKTQDGIDQDLNTMLKDGPLALVFVRSASW